MHQLDLVEAMSGVVERPRARRTDPHTSHQAAARILPKLREQQEAVLEAVRRFPSSTAVELAQAAGLDRYLISRRLPELASAGYVRRMPPRACRVNGRPQTTWHAT